jgi:hypothetical protein
VELFVIGIVLLGGYWASLHLHPYILCRVCKGSPPRHYGAMFSRKFRPCHHCGGRGRQPRFGAWLLGIGEPRARMSRWN